MFIEDPNKTNQHYLLPSQIFVTSDDYCITTVLGSCVSVCIWDKVKKFGGINHFMLPDWNSTGLATPKYGDIAMKRLLDKMIDLGSDKSDLVAKVFGGGEINQIDHSIFNIGPRNIKRAMRFLEENEIIIAGKSIGGNQGRKIMFCTATGAVRQKLISSLS